MANFNFSLILVLVVFITGVLTLLERWIWAPKRRQAVARYRDENLHPQEQIIHKLSKPNGLLENCVSVFPVLLIVLLLRSFLVEPFQIPSGSMIPTLKVGDFILVNKYTYGLRLPVIGTKIVSIGEPKRGDVMVFRFPPNPKIDYIKRIIGLPGDRLRYKNKQLYVNEKQVDTTFIASMRDDYDPKSGQIPIFDLYHATIDTHTFEIRTYPQAAQSKNQSTEWIVPKGMYFVMGDNRDKSYDSRFWGFVPEQNIVGRAFYIWMNWPHWYQLPSFKKQWNYSLMLSI